MSEAVSSVQYDARGDDQDFIPNPRYRAGLPAENVEERLWRLSRSDAAEHFELAARGIEVGEKGWFFAGRKRLLGSLVNWLNTAEDGVRIVTGPPGAGKSAVMGRLATLSDAQYRQEAIDAGVVKEGEDVIPPVGAIDVAVHAKGKTLDDCARALAKGLGIETGQEASVDIQRLVENIGKLDRKITLMVDALDEAAGGQGATIASRLIGPLGSLPHVRVLVGTRRSLDGAVIPEGEDRHGRLRATFGADAIIDDLEDEPETQDDIAAYVRLRLESSAKHRNDAAGNLADVAGRVATRANGIFLYARIVSRTLQEQDRLDEELPATALEAFEQDLGIRFEGKVRLVDDLLGALAWGEGKGLTRRVWPLVANALTATERPYDEDDIAWVLGHAGWHIIEAGEGGQTVYRLAHQGLADHYHDKVDETETQRRIVDAMRKGIQGEGWLNCDKYLWRHLADHAAKADRLDALICDPGYLAVADPARLVIVLPSVRSAEGRRFVGIYDRVVDRLVDLKPVDRMPLIHMNAQMEDPELAPRLEPPVATAWRCAWARMRPSTPHRVIGRHDSAVTTVALGIIDGASVIISGSGDGTIRRWDAHTGEPIGKPLEGHANWVNSVAFGVIDGAPVIISGSTDRTIRRWDAHRGEPIGKPLEGHGWTSVNSVAFGIMDGAPIIVSGGDDGTIRRWNARTGGPIDEPLVGHGGQIGSVKVEEIDGAPVIISGSHDNTIRRWDARTGGPIGKPLEVTGWASVKSVAFGVIDGAPVIVSGGDDGTIRRWDARTGRSIGKPLEGWTSVNSVAFGVIDGAPVIVSGGDDGTIRRWDARTGEPIAEPLRGHERAVYSVAFGMMDGAPVVVSGGWDNTVRRWDVRSGRSIGEPLETGWASVNSVAFGVIDGARVIVSGGDDGTTRRWDARTGGPIGEPLVGREGAISSVAFGVVDGRPVIVSRNADNTIRRWDARTGKPIGEPLGGLSALKRWFNPSRSWPIGLAEFKGNGLIAFGVIDGTPIIVSRGDDSAVRRWDARTGRSIGRPLKGTGRASVTSLAFGVIDGTPVIVSGSDDNTIRRWDARRGQSIGKPLEGHTSAIASLAVGVIDGAPVIISGSHDNTIRRWDARMGGAIGKPIEGHGDMVTSVVFGVIDGAPVIISGSWDNTVRRWDARTGECNQCLAIGESMQAIDMDDNDEVLVGLDRGIVLFELLTMPQK